MKHVFLLLTLCALFVFAEKNRAPEKFFTTPKLTTAGVIFSDQLSNGLFLTSNSGVAILSQMPGSGLYYTVSSDGNFIGFKEVDANGLQVPIVYDLKKNTRTLLHKESSRIGQVSFAQDGSLAFTVGNNFLVVSNGVEKNFSLGTYSNIAPISPNGKFVAYNDNSDQLWILNLETLEKTRITNNEAGYAFPQWSPDGSQILYSQLNGNLFVYSLPTRISSVLGGGDSPSWIDNSTIVFYQKKIEQEQLVSTDLFSINSNGTEKKQLTSTLDNFEIDPFFDARTNSIFYTDIKRGGIYSRSLSSEIQLDQELQVLSYENSLTQKTLLSKSISPTSTASVSFGMPYVHQRWDTPDWYNGSAACGATSAIMVIAYYNLVPKWNVWCSASGSSPAHYSPYGNYVCEKYSYREFSYSLTANDPNGNPSYGGYGFMWNGSSHPYSSMVSYYNNHGLSATLYDSNAAFFETVISNIDAGYPFSLCNGLTTAGHIIVVNGYDVNNRTLIVNDPYGDKNSGLYPSVNGKAVKYDWVGYNNGYKNLNRIYWGVSVKYNAVSQADSLVDDAQLDKGFYLHTAAPSSMTKWSDKKSGGYNNAHFWWTRTKMSDTCYATWTPTLAKGGVYEVSAFISSSEATMAKYKIFAKDSVFEVVINQKNIKNDWISLGIFSFKQGKNGFIRLGDGSDTTKQAIIFDAIKWSYRGEQPTSVSVNNKILEIFVLEQNFPNPFNPSTVISYRLPVSNRVTLKVYDVLGKEIAVLVNEQQEAGIYQTSFNAQGLCSGLYFYKLTAGTFSETKKMLLQK